MNMTKMEYFEALIKGEIDLYTAVQISNTYSAKIIRMIYNKHTF